MSSSKSNKIGKATKSVVNKNEDIDTVSTENENDSKRKDIEYGLEKEIEHLETLRDIFCKKLNKTNDKWFVFDYSCEDCYVELKSRRCNHDKYTDTMIGLNKINYCCKSKKPVYFCFNFEDGLYYWKYNEDDMCNGNVTIRKGGRNDRGFDETKDYGYIKTEILKKV